MIYIENLIGQKFGRLTIVDVAGRNKYGAVLYSCVCECGQIIKARKHSLTSGHTRSCGCLQKENFIKHGDSYTRLYGIWRDMKYRCNNIGFASYHRYGGRGIKVCDDWENDYVKFKNWALTNGYDDNLTIDRIDVDGNYEPSNCRWVTRKEQANNRYTNRFIELNGEIKSLKQWSEQTGIGSKTLEFRLDHNWPLEDVFNKPTDERYRRNYKDEP